MKRKGVLKLLILRTLGNFFILFTIFGFFATFGPALYYEVLYRVSASKGIHFTLADTQTELGKLLNKNEPTPVIKITPQPQPQGQDSLLGALLSGKKEHILTPKSTEFGILIPKIGANENITANVDPSNENEYLDVLQHSIAHAKGTAFPGLNGNIYLFAHSADSFWNVGRYNAVFYLLKELSQGDQVVLYFQNKRYDYFVTETKIVDAEDVSHINANLGQGEQVILQTCWPPGTSWKRLLVFAKPKI